MNAGPRAPPRWKPSAPPSRSSWAAWPSTTAPRGRRGTRPCASSSRASSSWGGGTWSRGGPILPGGPPRRLFPRFVGKEREHMETLAARYHVEPPAPGDLHLDRAALYAGVPNRPEEADNLFRIAIAFEEKVEEFFARHEKECPPGS